MQPNKKTMPTPKISVIVPVYNAEKSLCRCIDSILTQTYQDFELLLINDGSKDSSGAICDSYAAQDSRIKVFHKSNGGVSSARNLGIDNAQGEWLTFVDADDWVEENFSSMKIETYNEDIVCFPYIIVPRGMNLQTFGSEEKVYVSAADFYVSRLHTLFRSPWSKLYRRANVGSLRFDTRIKVGEDLAFNLQYLARVKTCRYVADIAFYCYDEPRVFFLTKYQMPIEQSVYSLAVIFKSYENLQSASADFERMIFTDYKKLCQEDIYMRPKTWYGSVDVKRIYRSIRHRFPLRFRFNYALMSIPVVNWLRVKLK